MSPPKPPHAQWPVTSDVDFAKFSTGEFQMFSPPIREEQTTLAVQRWSANIYSIYIFILATPKNTSLLQPVLSKLSSLQRYLIIILSLA